MEEVNKIILELKEKGYVLSIPRIAIIKYLVSNRTHHTAESIYKAISKEYPTISVATVYNTLKVLTNEGFVNQLFIEGERVFYDSTPCEHSHFICRICGKIKDIKDKPAKKASVDDNKIEKIYLYFYGICRECIEKKETKKQNKKI